MLFNDKGTVNIADVVRYEITYDPAHDPVNKRPILSHITSGGNHPHLFHHRIHLRIRNTASILLRAAYLQGPYSLCVSVRESTFKADHDTVEEPTSLSPVYDQDVKASTSFWTELACERKRTWIVEITSQAIFATASTSYTVTLGHTKDSTRKAAHGNELITSSPGVTIHKLTTEDLWAPPPILPHHKNIHLIVLTHGLHSNVTADMIYLKNRIEEVAGLANRPDGGIIIRGYSGNVTKTERGIKWLGKRMAKWLLKETLWLEQVGCFAPDAPPYSRISFIGHSLGGVVQNFAIAMVELMTNGEFFRKLQPVHFITLASPWLGVSAENPAYVKLALDVGLIGRTGQDLGLMNRLGQKLENLPDKNRIRDSRPILRLLALPNSPAHRVIRRFCTRTIYANVVNDGIVPLRTSAMFFLDWNSLEAVEKTAIQTGVLSGLPMIVGLPPFDHLVGEVERMFSPKRSETDDSRNSSRRPSTDNTTGSQLSIPSFFRRKSSAVPPRAQDMVKQNSEGNRSRSQSILSIKSHSFEIQRDIVDPTEDKDRRASHESQSTRIVDAEQEEKPEGTGLKRTPTTESTNRGPEGGQTLHSHDPAEKHVHARESRHPTLHIDTHLDDHPQQPNSEEITSLSDLERISKQTDLNDTDDSPETTQPERIVSRDLVQSPPPVETPLNKPPSKGPSDPNAPPATAPPKDDGQAQGDTTSNPILSLFQHFRPAAGKQPRRYSKVYHRSQIVSKSPSTDARPPPPRTSFLESFPSLINPPLPDANFITQPSSRPKTIFHDRVYTPDDIPPVTSSTETNGNSTEEQTTKREKLRLEEKIARDWHSDMTWRKVLVKLEPDAHNNIIVRRMFPNAYGWPVIDHLVREHFLRDPEGLESEFVQEVGVVAVDESSSQISSPGWAMEDSDSDEEGEPSVLSSVSVGRARLSDEENGEVVEMTDFGGQNGKTRGNGSGKDVHKPVPLDMQFT